MSIYQRLTDLPDNQFDQQLHDFDKRYRSTYMLYTKDEKDPPVGVYVTKIKNGQILLSTMEGDILVDGTKEGGLVPFLPAVGYYNMRGQAVFLTKAPQKQYKRSICTSIYKLTSPNKEAAIPYGGDWFPLVEAILAKEYVQLKDLTNPLFTNVAINRQFAITSHKGKNFLTYRRCPVGYLDYKERTINLTHKILEQEVRDLINKNGDSQWKLLVT